MANFIAIGDSVGVVTTGHVCTAITSTDECSSKVFVTGVGVVSDGDKNTSHTYPVGPSCPAHTAALSIFSNRVFIEGRGAGRQDDKYGAEEITGAGQSKVFAG